MLHFYIKNEILGCNILFIPFAGLFMKGTDKSPVLKKHVSVIHSDTSRSKWGLVQRKVVNSLLFRARETIIEAIGSSDKEKLDEYLEKTKGQEINYEMKSVLNSLASNDSASIEGDFEDLGRLGAPLLRRSRRSPLSPLGGAAPPLHLQLTS